MFRPALRPARATHILWQCLVAAASQVTAAHKQQQSDNSEHVEPVKANFKAEVRIHVGGGSRLGGARR